MDSGAVAHNYACPEDKARQEYYEVLDLTTSAIENRFKQQGMKVLTTIEQFIMNGISGTSLSSQLEFLTQYYNDDLNVSSLESEIKSIASLDLEHINDINAFIGWLKENDRTVLYPELTKLIRLVLVLPATNACSERSFSAMRRLKTFLRASMTQQRLNNLMMLHIHQGITSQLDPQSIIAQFVSGHHD